MNMRDSLHTQPSFTVPRKSKLRDYGSQFPVEPMSTWEYAMLVAAGLFIALFVVVAVFWWRTA